MKKFALVLVILLALGFVVVAESKTADTAKLAVSFNPLGIILNMYPGSVELAITNQIAVKADFVFSPNFFWVSNMSFIDAIVGGRFYFGSMLGSAIPEAFTGPALRGLFAGGKAAIAFWTWDYGYDYVARMMQLGFGVEAGTKYFFKGAKGFYGEGTLGYMLYLPAVWTWTYLGETIVDPGYDNTYSASGLSYSLSIGFAF